MFRLGIVVIVVNIYKTIVLCKIQVVSKIIIIIIVIIIDFNYIFYKKEDLYLEYRSIYRREYKPDASVTTHLNRHVISER